MSNGKVKKWRKVLYDNADYPDNYTPDECFLAARRFNQNLVTYSLGQCVGGGAEVAIHLSLVIIFWCCYNFIKAGVLPPAPATAAVMGTSVAAYLLLLLASSSSLGEDILQGAKACTLFTVTGYAVSPVLYTLTDTISTDSIHLMAAASLLLHLVTADYGVAAPVVSWQISLNAAVFGSVCLASRFPDHMSAFCLLTVSVFCFLLVPLCRSWCRPLASSLPWSLVTSLASLLLLAAVSLTHTYLAALSLFTVQVLCPVIFYRLQSDKLTIHGPWDEATPGSS